MLPEVFVIIGTILTFISTGIYLAGTIKGTVKPNRVSFFIWGLAPLIAFAAQLSEGVGIQSLLTFSIGFGPLLIFAASFLHKGTAWKLSLFDYICGMLAIIGLILWQLTKDGIIAIFLSLVADILASIPTIVKSYKAPQTESASAYFITFLGALFILFTITTWDFETVAYPLYVVLLNIGVYVLLRVRIVKIKIH